MCGYFTGSLLLRNFELHKKTDPLSGVRSFFCRTFDLGGYFALVLVLRDLELHLKTDPVSGVRSFFCWMCDLDSA